MRRFAWVLLGAVALAGAGTFAYRLGVAVQPPERVGTVLDDPQETADLTLTAEGGRRVSLGDVAADAEWTLVFFGFVDCPDVCPVIMSRLAETYRELGEPNELQVVMITVDPERDDPARLGEFVRGFHPDFRGLGGSAEDIAAAASRFFIGYNDASGEIIHTEAVAVLDGEARMRMVYMQGKVHGLREDLPALLERGRL